MGTSRAHRIALRRVELALGALAAGLSLACGSDDPSARQEDDSRPSLILVSIDSLRADHLGCYGHGRETSPFLDELAARGVRFADAVSTTSWTLPAHAALFTGLFDGAHGLVDNGLSLGEAHLTLAELLGREGYGTAGFYGGPYLHPTFGLGQGFDEWVSCMAPAAPAEGDAVRLDARSERSRSHVDVTGPRTREAIARWADDVDEPYFLFVHLWDVHYDYRPPAEYVERFDPDYDGPIDGTDVMGDERIHAGMSTRDREHLLALYDAEIRFTDDVLRGIVDDLDARGLLENAWIVVTSDHGEEFFEHGHKGHQRTLYDEVLRVPLIVSGPGVVPGVVEEQVRLVDLFPTLAALAGIPGPLAIQGTDLGPLLRGESLDVGDALAELYVNELELQALRTGTHKLIVEPKTRRSQFFDLEQDPGEERALHAMELVADPERVRLAEELRAALARTERVERFLGSRAVDAADTPEDVRALLEALGYAGAPSETRPAVGGED